MSFAAVPVSSSEPVCDPAKLGLIATVPVINNIKLQSLSLYFINNREHQIFHYTRCITPNV